MRRHLPLVALLLAATLAGVALVAPSLREPGALAPESRFTDGHLIGLGMWGQALARGGLPELHTPLAGWPAGAALRPLLWPSALLAAFVGPVWALTLTYALTPVFNALCGWILGAALGRGAAGRVALGGLLALHPWVVETLANGQVEQAVFGGAALQLGAAVWAAGRLAAGAHPGGAAAGVARVGAGSGGARAGARLALGVVPALLLPGLTTTLVGWAAPHVALAGALLVGGWAIFPLLAPGAGGGAVAAPPPGAAAFGGAPGATRIRLAWVLVLVAVAAGALAVNAYHAGNFEPGAHVFSPKGSAGRPTWLGDVPEVATPAALLLPPARAPGGAVVHPMWLGGVALLSALVVAGRAITDTRAGACALADARSPTHARAIVRPLAIAAGFAILALGPSLAVGGTSVPLPFAALGAVAPTVAQSMSAYRMAMGAVIALAVAVSAGFSAAGNAGRASGSAGRAAGGRVAAALLVTLALAEGPLAATRGVPLPAQPARPDPSGPALAARTGPVLDLPLAGPACPSGAGHYLLEAAYTGRPVPVLLTNAREAYAAVPGLTDGLARAWRRKDCPDELRDLLARLPFTAVVLHTHGPTCPVEKHVETCLVEALGPGTAADNVRWWHLGPDGADGRAGR